MAPVQPIVKVENLSHDGRGIAHIEGKIVFIEGALVGEEVQVELVRTKSRYSEAKIIQVLQPAADRQSPPCSAFSFCGGCSLQHMRSQAQLAHKQATLLEQLRHIGGVEPRNILPPITSKTEGYRRKARLGVRYVIKKEKLLVGFREKNGRYLADIDTCSVLDSKVGQQLPLLRDFLLQLENHLQVPQLEIATGDFETAIIIRHLRPFSASDLRLISEFGEKNGFHIYLQSGGPDTATLFYPPNCSQRLSYRLLDFNLEILFHPTDFTQVNSEVNNKLIKLAIELLAPCSHETVLDLFCGIGNFTLPLAGFCKKVVGVEGSQLMVERGYENAVHNNITNIEFKCKNLAEYNYNNNWLMDHFDAILLDPPRVGAWEIIQPIACSTATRLVYVSCNPATLARDAGYLCKNGFDLTTIGVLDMFPHTSHVESIALFTRT